MTTRREFIRNAIAAATAAAVGISAKASAEVAEAEKGLKWDRSPCRFCGVGCGMLVGTRGERVVAVKGEPDSPVNRGLLCVKGYANARILYGADRLTRPLRRMDAAFEMEPAVALEMVMG